MCTRTNMEIQFTYVYTCKNVCVYIHVYTCVYQIFLYLHTCMYIWIKVCLADLYTSPLFFSNWRKLVGAKHLVTFGQTSALAEILSRLRVLEDLRWCIRHHSSLETSARLNKVGSSAGPRFDSGRKPVNSNPYGFVQIDPQARVLNYGFQ